MNLLPTAEQEEIATATAAFLRSSVPMSKVRALIDQRENVDPTLWQACGELGWFALGLPADVGGVGGSLADEALLFREIGRSLAPGPYVATVLGARAAAFGGAQGATNSIVAGTSRVALAVVGDTAVVGPDRVTGALQLLDAVGAEYALVVTRDVAVLITTECVRDVVDVACIDDATRLAVGHVDAAATVAAVPSTSDPVHRRGLVLTAATLVGIAEATRDIAAEHAQSRVQFDRPIGVNQGVKHPCADTAVRCEAAWAQTVVGALAHDEGRDDADEQIDSAWVVAADAAQRNAATALQVLGGMGFTFEHDVNLYVKRAHVLARAVSDRRTTLDHLLGRG